MTFLQFWKVVMVIVLIIQFNTTCGVLECFECSDFPREEYSEDEEMGTCPGWLRPPRTYSETSIYDGCMTILLANGTVVSQNAIQFSECNVFQKKQRIALKNLFGISVRIRCCKGERCNAPKKLQEKLNIIRQNQKKEKAQKARDFFARYYLQDDAEVDSDLSNPKSTALQAKHKSDKTIRMTSSEFQVTPSCFCKGSKYVSSPKGIIFLFLFPTFLKLFYI